jgi:uncharacterized membrane protein
MKKVCALLLAAGLAVLTGCENKSTPGGPGATGGDKDHKPILGQSDNSFSLDVPKLTTDVKQGETKQITIGISRGKNFDQDVKLDFSGAPAGVTVKPASSEIKKGDKEVAVSIEAAKDAALGDHTITVTGKPEKEGQEGKSTFKIDVKKP